MKIITLPINEIVIGERRREEFGDIQGLADSIAKFGLFHPIVVDDQNNLIAGERRLIACKSLEWSEVPCRLYRELTDEERSEIELDENLKRKDLTPYEASKQLLKNAKKIEPFISSAAEEKDSRGRKSQGSAPKKDVAGALGIGVASLVRAEQHINAVEKHPELSIIPTQKEAIAAGKALDAMPEKERDKAKARLMAEGHRAITSIINKPKAKPKSISSKYSDNLSQIQTFIMSIKSVGAGELTASWTERERHAFLTELRDCRDDMSSLISELESIETELQRAS